MLTLQFGQCGNQLGHALFKQISNDLDAKDTGVSKQTNISYVDQSFEKWFTDLNKNRKRLARSILIDTEYKVIKKICTDSGEKWAFKSQNCICQATGGSANNWAYGYLNKGPQLKTNILELSRKEIEKLDHFQGILLLLSSAGGTGSGVGSYSAQLLRDEFPNKSIVSSVILPFIAGEIGVQNYNTLLTLAKLSDCIDLNFLFQNDQIQSICTNALRNTETKLFDMNDVISRKLSALLQPVDNFWCNLNFIASKLCVYPSCRLATINSTPHISSNVSEYESFYSWRLYIQHLKKTLQKSSSESKFTDAETKVPGRSNYKRHSYTYYKSISNLLISRGRMTEGDPMVCEEFRSKDMYVDWTQSRDQFTFIHQERRFLNQEKFLALATNNSHIYETIEQIVEKAWNTYTSSAFLHHYRKFGLEDDDFLQAFAKCESLIRDYKSLY